MRFLYSGKYRRDVLVENPCKRLYKIGQSKRNSHTKTKMQVDFPSMDQIGKLKNAVDAVEIKLRGGSILTDYGAVVQGTQAAAETGLKTWETTVTLAKSGNAMGEVMLGGHALGEALVEFKKGHYFCCACSGIACACFWIGAAAGIIPGGYGVWQAATQAGAVTKGVTYTCRRVTGGF